jgi:hypothetical protein
MGNSFCIACRSEMSSGACASKTDADHGVLSQTGQPLPLPMIADNEKLTERITLCSCCPLLSHGCTLSLLVQAPK